MSNIRKGYVLDNKERRGLAKQTMLFVLPRLPFTVLGTIVGVLFPAVFAYISARLRLDHIAIITTLGGFIGAFVYKLVLTWGAREYKAGMVAVIACKLERGIVPAPVFKKGLLIVHTFFESATFGRVFINLIVSLYRRVLKKEKGRSVKLIMHASAIQFRDAILVFVMDLLPYLGISCLYYVFAHTELTTIQAYSEGAKQYFKNYNKMILRIIKNALSVCVILLISFCVFFIVFLLICGLEPMLITGTAKLMEFTKLMAYEELTGSNTIMAPVILSIIFSIIVVVLSQPLRIIKTLERFKVVCDKNTAQGSKNIDLDVVDDGSAN